MSLVDILKPASVPTGHEALSRRTHRMEDDAQEEAARRDRRGRREAAQRRAAGAIAAQPDPRGPEAATATDAR
jgi:hypothetical protein